MNRRRLLFVGLILVLAAVAPGCRQALSYAPSTTDQGPGDAAVPPDGPTEGGPASDGPVSDGPVSDGPVSDGSASDGLDGATDLGADAGVDPALLVDDDWQGAKLGTEVAPGHLFGDNAFGTITAALAAAQPGDTVRVRSGRYAEQVRVKVEGLSLIGEGTPVIDGDTNGNGLPDLVDLLTINADKVTVEGFELTTGGDGLVVLASHVVVRSNRVHDMYNTATNRGVGILLWGGLTGCKVLDNEVYRNDRQGIYLGYGDRTLVPTKNLIQGNLIYENGLYRAGGGSPNSAHGINLQNADDNEIVDNICRGHRDASANGSGTGLDLWMAHDNKVRGLQASENDIGVSIIGSDRTEIRDSQLSGNDVGLRADAASTKVQFIDGAFCGNANKAVVNLSADPVKAIGCWWGAPGGPATGQIQGPVDSSSDLSSPPVSGPCAP